MQKVILISGFGGSGKSTCSALLWNRLENVAIVEADHLFRIKPFELGTAEGRQKVGEIKLENTLAVLRTFLEEDFEHIIVDGLVWSQSELDAVVKECQKADCVILLFWLKTSKEVRHKRAIHRARDEADSQKFLDEVEKNIHDPTPFTFDACKYCEIETDRFSAEQVAYEMMKVMNTNS